MTTGTSPDDLRTDWSTEMDRTTTPWTCRHYFVVVLHWCKCTYLWQCMTLWLSAKTPGSAPCPPFSYKYIPLIFRRYSSRNFRMSFSSDCVNCLGGENYRGKVTTIRLTYNGSLRSSSHQMRSSRARQRHVLHVALHMTKLFQSNNWKHRSTSDISPCAKNCDWRFLPT